MFRWIIYRRERRAKTGLVESKFCFWYGSPKNGWLNHIPASNMQYYVKFQVKTTSCTQVGRLSGPAPQTARAAAALIFLVWNEPDTDSNQGPIVPTMTLISALAPPLPARRVADPNLPESCPPSSVWAFGELRATSVCDIYAVIVIGKPMEICLRPNPFCNKFVSAEHRAINQAESRASGHA